jgi:hypothetical protein
MKSNQWEDRYETNATVAASKEPGKIIKKELLCDRCKT